MAERDSGAALLRLTFGTLHSAGLVTLLVLGIHLGGATGDLLAGVGTLPGIGVYAYLWVLTWWSAGRWLEAVDGSLIEASIPTDRAFVAGAQYGAATGGLFLAGVLVPVSAIAVTTTGLTVVLNLLVLAGLGLLAALLFGAAVGLVFTAVDLGVAALARRLVPGATDTP